MAYLGTQQFISIVWLEAHWTHRIADNVMIIRVVYTTEDATPFTFTHHLRTSMIHQSFQITLFTDLL